jgi:hypothetical protein
MLCFFNRLRKKSFERLPCPMVHTFNLGLLLSIPLTVLRLFIKIGDWLCLKNVWNIKLKTIMQGAGGRDE